MYGDGVAIPADVGVPVAHRHADPVRPASGLGGRHVHRRSGSAGADHAGGDVAARADQGPRPGRPRLLPRRRVPPRDRGAVDVARAVDVVRAATTAGAVGDRPEHRLRRSADTGRHDGGRRPARRQRSRRPDAMAGHAVAERRSELPLGLPAHHLARAPDVLAGAHPQPRAASRGLPDRRGHRSADGRPAGGVRASLRLGALRRRAQPIRHAPDDDGELGPVGDRHRAAGTLRRRVSGRDEGGDQRRVHVEPTVSWNAAGQESNPLVWDGEPVTTSS